jgi:hypothetical protein
MREEVREAYHNRKLEIKTTFGLLIFYPAWSGIFLHRTSAEALLPRHTGLFWLA